MKSSTKFHNCFYFSSDLQVVNVICISGYRNKVLWLDTEIEILFLFTFVFFPLHLSLMCFFHRLIKNWTVHMRMHQKKFLLQKKLKGRVTCKSFTYDALMVVGFQFD